MSSPEYPAPTPTDSALDAETAALLARLAAQDAALKTLEAERDQALVENEKLRKLIKEFQRAIYGRRSERLDPDQLALGLEDQEQGAASIAAADEDKTAPPDGEPSPETASRPRAKARPRRNRGALPKHLPRVQRVIDIEDKTCSHCGNQLHQIGETVTEQLDVIPARFQVIETKRPRYACRCCAEGVVEAPTPTRPIAGGMATTALVALILVGKFADHLPLYRQAQIFSRQGIDLDRSTLADWVGRSCWWLAPLYERLVASIMRSSKIFSDDTPVPVLSPGRKQTKTGRMWAYARDDRPWQGDLPPAVAYVYAGDRGSVRPKTHLATFSGTLQVDAYQAYKTIAASRRDRPILLAFCWAHTRRKFYDVHKGTQSPVAEAVLKRIAELYRVEDKIRGEPPDRRREVRQAESRPIVEALKEELERQARRVPAKSALAGAIQYALGHWEGLTRFLDDGRLELDTNTVERGMRGIKLCAKNCLFAGSDEGAQHWAIIASLIETCKLNNVDPYAYLRDVLERIVSGETKITELDRLLPWHWAADQARSPGGIDGQPEQKAAA